MCCADHKASENAGWRGDRKTTHPAKNLYKGRADFPAKWGIWRLFQRLIAETDLAVDRVDTVSYYAPRSPVFTGLNWGYSSAGRALAWHARGQRFDPAYLHQLPFQSKLAVSFQRKQKVNVYDLVWGYSSAGRALAWHARGQRFDPAYLHQILKKPASAGFLLSALCHFLLPVYAALELQP